MPSRHPILAVLVAAPFAALLAWTPAAAGLLEGLPGREVTATPRIAETQAEGETDEDTIGGVNWLSRPVHLQLSRDPALVTLGKGAVFVPTYSEGRREPEVAVYRGGNEVATGQTGTRILLDSGTFDVRFGSGPAGRRLRSSVRIEEGHTTTVPPTWGGLIVETLSETGEYISAGEGGQYDLIRMDPGTSYGRGQGYTEERLQDIEVWILPPGLYRISRVGEGFNSLRNYITVQVNAGELHTVEAVFNEAGNLIAGGSKSLDARTRVGQYWKFGLRAGGNASFIRSVDEADASEQNYSFSTDMRLRARYEREDFFGINELFIQNSFAKNDGEPLIATADYLQLRTTWVRRLNNWIGPYVRGQVTTHLFPSEVAADTISIIQATPAGPDTVQYTTDGQFEYQPSFFPLLFAEGAGVNVEWLSRYSLEISTQSGLAARQQFSRGDYLARTRTLFERQSSFVYSVGAEAVLNGRLRLSSQFILDLRAEVFAENANPEELQLENLEADLRFFLTRNIEIGYLYQVRETLENVANRFPTTHSVSLRLSFNY
jgi:hypothetical protein